MKEPVLVIAQIKAKAGQEDQVKSVLVGLVKSARRELGCLYYELLQSRSNPYEFLLIEEWETQTHLDSHTAASHTKTAAVKIEALIEAVPPDVQHYRTIA